MAETRPDLFDLVVAGAGVVGLALALAARRGASPSPRVLVCDPSLNANPARSFRAVAIAAGSRRFLESLGVWQAVAGAAAPMTEMVLTDAPPGALPAPVYLDFEGEVAPGEPFAHMVPHDDLRDALVGACRAAGVVLRPSRVTGFSDGPVGLRLMVQDGSSVVARLLAAADGSRSLLREKAGITTIGWDYGQASVVATLAHEREHGGRAIQHFLPGGPLALLPMRGQDGSGRRISIVWTEKRAEADRLLSLSPEAFVAELEGRIGHQLGALRLEDRPSAHPLRVSLARALVARRFALVGDAARTIHPLAGQGLNLGLRDAAALAATVLEATRLGLDPGEASGLAAYSRARRADSAAMAATTDLLNRLFSNASTPARLLRDLGLGLVDRAPGLKRRLIREAAGTDRSGGPGGPLGRPGWRCSEP